jgi:Holliday junction resolvasome RuvABC endonuclease subunit
VDKIVNVLGLDPSMSNFGMAIGFINVSTNTLTMDRLSLQKTVPAKVKSVRKNSDDLYRAKQLYLAMTAELATVDLVMVEIPVGSQSARAMASYGVCIGVLAAVNKPMIQVTPTEVKMATAGTKTASKANMIKWATNEYPYLNWLTKKQKGVVSYTGDNEHLADAIGAIHAGMRTSQYKDLIEMSLKI